MPAVASIARRLAPAGSETWLLGVPVTDPRTVGAAAREPAQHAPGIRDLYHDHDKYSNGERPLR